MKLDAATPSPEVEAHLHWELRPIGECSRLADTGQARQAGAPPGGRSAQPTDLSAVNAALRLAAVLAASSPLKVVPPQFEASVSIRPQVRAGRPCIAGTRIKVSTVLEGLAAGLSLRKIAAGYPGVTVERVADAARYAARVLD